MLYGSYRFFITIPIFTIPQLPRSCWIQLPLISCIDENDIPPNKLEARFNKVVARLVESIELDLPIVLTNPDKIKTKLTWSLRFQKIVISNMRWIQIGRPASMSICTRYWSSYYWRSQISYKRWNTCLCSCRYCSRFQQYRKY